jgi:hypothetical protein
MMVVIMLSVVKLNAIEVNVVAPVRTILKMYFGLVVQHKDIT